MKNVDFDKICREVLKSLKNADVQKNSDERKSNLVDAFQKSTVYVCAEVLKKYHAAVSGN